MTSFRTHLGWLLIAVSQFFVAGDCWAGPTFSAGVSTGNITNSQVQEASGIVASRKNANILWTHNDSNNDPKLFPTTPAGADLGVYTVSGTTNTDWEDIAVGPGPTLGVQYLYVGDIGDNKSERSDIKVYRVPEPTVSQFQPSTTNVSIAGAATLTFAFPASNRPRDAESMFVDPLTRDIYIITKRESPHRVFRAAYPQSTTSTTTLELVTEFSGSPWYTAADISPDGNEIIIRATENTSGRMYVRPAGGSIADAFNSTPISIPLVTEDQGEAIGFDPTGWGYYTTSEGVGAPITYFNRIFNGDYNQNKTIDAADYVLGRNNAWSATAYNAWRSGFGKTSPPNWSLTAVPEPMSALQLLASALTITIARLTRSQRRRLPSLPSPLAPG